MDPGDAQPDFFRSLDSDTDPVSWINNLLQNGAREPSDLNSLEKHLNNIIPALEVASEDLSLHIERLIEEISRSASRLPYDLHFMRDGALSVQIALNSLTNRSTSFSPQSSATLDRLHSLDIVKRHMELARDVLREAESWSTLESEVSSLLSEQNYEKAAEKLSEANKSMIVFQNTPEYEARRALMISLQNQLEASLSSALIAAINSHEIALCRHYYTIFGNIQRGSEFRAYYFGSRRSSLITTWQDAQLSDAGDSSVSLPAARQTSDFLTAFFADFLTMLNSERASTSAIFPDPQLTLSSFITSTFSTLQPTFTERLSALCDHHGPAVLIELIASFQATEKFAVAADKILERTEASTPSLSPPSDGTNSESTSKSFRRRSSHSRLSISRRMSLSSSATGALQLLGSGLDWDTEVYEPFLEYQVSYGALETKLLFSSLPDSSLQAEPARGLRERTLDVFSLAEESLSRMQAFTHGYGAAVLVSSLDDFLAAFIDSSRASFVSFMPASTASVVAGSGAEDLADLDYTFEDYSAIQVWLHLLESLRGVRDRLSVFESQLRGTLLQVSIAFRAHAHDPRASLPGTTRGALQLLSQSTLNSHHLHDLLDSVQLPEGRQPTQDLLASLVQTSLQGAMLSPLHKSLANYASSPLWTASSQGAPRRVGGGGATSDAAVPTFSLSPSEAMQRAAEGLLNLPRLFEVYADDDVLSFSIETLPHVDSALLESLTEPTVGEPPSSIHARRASIARPPTSAFTPEAIASVWLSSLSLSLLEHVTEKVLPSIGSLTSAGAAQLSSDLGYLGNIVNAVGVESKELGRWMEVVGMDEDTGKTTALEVDGSDPILVVVAKMRGWTLA
ncbi:Golgi complex component 7-domain-containing protein [Lactarius akahatsu]|uniref:Conserved oligomeric Golgi complex subunit 7 n=1 Tax=Lactarius akahatsu TaxID=416441 RepID=A0AAD4LN20_9AGAM|nr:Golgi complex component 7-domain-containing protein [Lactarius akahatsu]